jgi:glycosyltransferase involved in cell wall biosynthesis
VVIVQNIDDRDLLLKNALARDDNVELIPGSGVRLADFQDCSVEKKLPIVLLPARMLFDKGIREFVEAVRLIKPRVSGWRFLLAGAGDYQNPTAIPDEQLKAWQSEGLVEWLGHVEHIAPYFAEASIVCLPSYREGMPKVLLEAAAAGCGVITTDTVGCREAIIPGETGDMVPVGDSQSLADALLLLINDRDRRERYGKAGKNLARSRYSIDAVVAKTNQIYDRLLVRT